MPIIDCPKCGDSTSNKTAACPHCGYGVAAHLYKQSVNEQQPDAWLDDSMMSQSGLGLHLEPAQWVEVARLLFALVVTAAVLYMWPSCDEEPEQEVASAPPARQSAEEKACGYKPGVLFSGAPTPIERHVERHVNDEGSVEWHGCTEAVYINDDKCWIVGCEFSAKNAMGGRIKQEILVHIKHGEVTSSSWP